MRTFALYQLNIIHKFSSYVFVKTHVLAVFTAGLISTFVNLVEFIVKNEEVHLSDGVII